MKKTLLFLTLFFVLPHSFGKAEPSISAVVSCNATTLTGRLSGSCYWGDYGYRLMIFVPEQKAAQHTPLLYLLGGPGILAEPQQSRFRNLAERLGRPVLVPAFGDSLRALMCATDAEDDTLQGIDPDPEKTVQQTRDDLVASLERCLVQLEPDVPSASVGTETFAGSLIRLREILAVPHWYIMGESYGGRLALTLAEQDPQSVVSMILDSPDTPWVSGYYQTATNFRRSLGQLGRLCSKDYYCVGKRIAIEQELLMKIGSHTEGGLAAVPLKDAETGLISGYVRPTRVQLSSSAFNALRRPDRAALLPYIAAARRQDVFLDRYGLLLNQLLQRSEGLNFGVFHSIRCRELPLAQWYRALHQERSINTDLSSFLDYLAWRQDFICSKLGIAPPDALLSPQVTNIPIMLLSGGIDPVTPAAVVDAALSGYPKITRLHYETLGHVVSAQKGCVVADIREFIDTGHIGRTGCRKSDLRLRFYAPVVIR